MFAGGAALVAMVVVIGTIGVFDVLLPFVKLGRTNLDTLALIHCTEPGRTTVGGGELRSCDIRDLKNDWELDAADFVVFRAARFFVQANPQYRGLWLNYSDPIFIQRFRDFGTWETPAGEVWRLYSERREIGNRGVEIMVGLRAKASWLLVDQPLSPLVDARLKDELDKIARITVVGDRIVSRRINSNVDGYQIVEAKTGGVIRWNGEMPALFPKERGLSVGQTSIYHEGADLFLVRTDENEDVLAASLSPIGSMLWISVAVAVVGGFVFLLAYVLGVGWLRRYFTLRGGRPTTVAEALAAGEGQTIEFKHGLTEDPLLRAITAFANTNDGTVFIGIDDEGRVRGLEFQSSKAKDEFRHKVYSLVRDRIQPIPAVDLDFEPTAGMEVARLFVRRGDALLYYFRGVNFIRHGESNVIPRPEQIVRILDEYAF
jgi:schlafen family protein